MVFWLLLLNAVWRRYAHYKGRYLDTEEKRRQLADSNLLQAEKIASLKGDLKAEVERHKETERTKEELRSLCEKLAAQIQADEIKGLADLQAVNRELRRCWEDAEGRVLELETMLKEPLALQALMKANLEAALREKAEAEEDCRQLIEQIEMYVKIADQYEWYRTMVRAAYPKIAADLDEKKRIQMESVKEVHAKKAEAQRGIFNARDAERMDEMDKGKDNAEAQRTHPSPLLSERERNPSCLPLSGEGPA